MRTLTSLFFSIIIFHSAIHGQDKYKFETYAGSVDGFLDGERTKALLRSPEGITMDNKGNLYITEYLSSIIRKIDSKGKVSILAGQPLKTGFADGKPSQSLINRPHGIAVDNKGNIFFCDMKNHLIRKVDSKGIVSTVAGEKGKFGVKDGMGKNAQFSQPEGVVIDSKGNLFIADTYNFTVRKIDKKGNVTTFSGLGGRKGYANGQGKKALFNMPIGIAIDKNDNLFVLDAIYDSSEQGNSVIRKIDPKGNVTTFAGVQGKNGHKDGKLREAIFNKPVGISVANDGTIFVADTEADLIRKIDINGNVTTIGGQYLIEKIQDGIGDKAAFFDPQSLVIAPNGDIFITDTLNNKIIVGRKIK
jgi:DNA-binding beta-propeller fold protein YncE